MPRSRAGPTYMSDNSSHYLVGIARAVLPFILAITIPLVTILGLLLRGLVSFVAYQDTLHQF